MAGPFFFEINNCNDYCFSRRNSKHDPNILTIGSISFERELRFWFVSLITFLMVNSAFSQDLSYFIFSDHSAIHSATGMFGIDKLGGISIKGFRGLLPG